MAVNVRLKKAIEEIKFKFKLNQGGIAEKLGVRNTYLSDMINGRVPLSTKMKVSIYKEFHIDMNEYEHQTQSSDLLHEPESPPYNNTNNSCPDCARSRKIIEYLKDESNHLREENKFLLSVIEQATKDKERLWNLIEGND